MQVVHPFSSELVDVEFDVFEMSTTSMALIGQFSLAFVQTIIVNSSVWTVQSSASKMPETAAASMCSMYAVRSSCSCASTEDGKGRNSIFPKAKDARLSRFVDGGSNCIWIPSHFTCNAAKGPDILNFVRLDLICKVEDVAVRHLCVCYDSSCIP